MLAPRDLADWILADGRQVRMQVQLHKLLWGQRAGEVAGIGKDGFPGYAIGPVDRSCVAMQ